MLKKFTTAQDFKFHDYCFPILYSLQNDKSSTIFTRHEIIAMVVQDLQIPNDQIEILLPNNNNDSMVKHRIGWGMSFLKKGGYLEQPKSRFWGLTDKGKQVAKENDLNSFWAKVHKDSIKEKSKLPKLSKNSSKNISMEEDPIEPPSWQDILIEKMRSMHSTNFELFCADLLKQDPFNIEITQPKGGTGDGGIDIEGRMIVDHFLTYKVGIQCKRTKNSKVPPKDIQAFYGAIKGKNIDRGVFITTSDFTAQARRTAETFGTKITLINKEELCDLIVKTNYFLEPVTTYEIKVNINNKYFESD